MFKFKKWHNLYILFLLRKMNFQILLMFVISSQLLILLLINPLISFLNLSSLSLMSMLTIRQWVDFKVSSSFRFQDCVSSSVWILSKTTRLSSGMICLSIWIVSLVLSIFRCEEKGKIAKDKSIACLINSHLCYFKRVCIRGEIKNNNWVFNIAFTVFLNKVLLYYN